MQRDMNLVREILKWGIAQPHGSLSSNPSLDGYTDEQIGYHVYLMKQTGLVDAAIRNGIGLPSPTGILLEVTWAGHDFLDAAADDTIWAKAKKTILKSGAEIAFDVLKAWLIAEAKQKYGIG